MLQGLHLLPIGTGRIVCPILGAYKFRSGTQQRIWVKVVSSAAYAVIGKRWNSARLFAPSYAREYPRPSPLPYFATVFLRITSFFAPPTLSTISFISPRGQKELVLLSKTYFSFLLNTVKPPRTDHHRSQIQRVTVRGSCLKEIISNNECPEKGMRCRGGEGSVASLIGHHEVIGISVKVSATMCTRILQILKSAINRKM